MGRYPFLLKLGKGESFAAPKPGEEREGELNRRERKDHNDSIHSVDSVKNLRFRFHTQYCRISQQKRLI
jgi:hypothetical protein